MSGPKVYVPVQSVVIEKTVQDMVQNAIAEVVNRFVKTCWEGKSGGISPHDLSEIVKGCTFYADYLQNYLSNYLQGKHREYMIATARTHEDLRDID